MSKNNCTLRFFRQSLKVFSAVAMLMLCASMVSGFSDVKAPIVQPEGQKPIIEKAMTMPLAQVAAQGAAKTIWTPKGYKKYSRVLHCEATAYTHTGNNTSLGFKPYEGIVAVDPRVIPYYTKLYIPGYGLAMAGDTGGDMVHHRIDVFFNSRSKALQWGRRNVEVYILEE